MPDIRPKFAAYCSSFMQFSSNKFHDVNCAGRGRQQCPALSDVRVYTNGKSYSQSKNTHAYTYNVLKHEIPRCQLALQLILYTRLYTQQCKALAKRSQTSLLIESLYIVN